MVDVQDDSWPQFTIQLSLEGLADIIAVRAPSVVRVGNPVQIEADVINNSSSSETIC